MKKLVLLSVLLIHVSLQSEETASQLGTRLVALSSQRVLALGAGVVMCTLNSPPAYVMGSVVMWRGYMVLTEKIQRVQEKLKTIDEKLAQV